jgi:hypothetical protein
MKHIFISILALALGFQVEAAKIKFGLPLTGGTGCPNGEGRVTKSSNGNVLIEHPSLQLGGAVNALFERQSCQIRIPVSGIPAGYKLVVRSAITDLNYVLTPGDQLKIEQSAGFVGGRNSSPQPWTASDSSSGQNIKIGRPIPALPLGETLCGSTDAMLSAGVNAILLKTANSSGSQVQLSRTLLSLRLVRCL